MPKLSRFHPESIAIDRAHCRRHPGTCASDRQELPRPPCNCIPDPVDLEQVWAGRARMARARRAADVPLDDTDVAALERAGL